MRRLDVDPSEAGAGPFHVITGPNGGCSMFAESGDEVVSVAPWTGGGHGARAVLAGEEWEFRAAGTRRLRILGRPVADEHASVGFVGSSTSGVIMLGEDARPYRFRNPLVGRSRVEDPDGDPLIAVRVRYLPRFRVSYHIVSGGAEPDVVVPILGVLACLTVLSVSRPSLHWTTLFAGAPAHARRSLKRAMARRLLDDDDPFALPAGNDEVEGADDPSG